MTQFWMLDFFLFNVFKNLKTVFHHINFIYIFIFYFLYDFMKNYLIIFWLLCVSFVFATEDPFADLDKLIEDAGAKTWASTTHNSANKILDEASNEERKYAWVEKIEAWDIQNNSITIKTTEVLYANKAVNEYRVYFAESSLATIQDTSKIQDNIIKPTESKDGMVSLILNGLKENTTYYIVVSPVNPTNPSAEALSMISDEINVKTTSSTNTSWTPTTISIENVAYTYTDNTVTITWTPLASDTTIDVQMRHQSETSYKKVGTVKWSIGKMSFDVTKAWNYFLKMSVSDSSGNMIGKEHIQTIKVDSIQTPKPSEPVVQTAPKVWPTSNLFFWIGLFSLLLYIVYRFRKIEA